MEGKAILARRRAGESEGDFGVSGFGRLALENHLDAMSSSPAEQVPHNVEQWHWGLWLAVELRFNFYDLQMPSAVSKSKVHMFPLQSYAIWHMTYMHQLIHSRQPCLWHQDDDSSYSSWISRLVPTSGLIASLCGVDKTRATLNCRPQIDS